MIQKNLFIEPETYFPESMYRNNKIPPIQNTSIPNMQIRQTVKTYIPPDITNFYYSKQSFDLETDASANNIIYLINNFCSFWDSLQLSTADNSIHFINITSNAHVINKFVMPYFLDFRKRNESEFFLVYSKRDKKNILAAEYLETDPLINDYLSSGVLINKVDSLFSPSYFIRDITKTLTPGDPLKMKISYNLRDLFPSIFWLNNDLLLSTNLMLTQTNNPKIFISVAAPTQLLNTLPNITGTSNIKISNIYTHIFSQTNDEMKNLIIQRSENKEELIIPYIVVENFSPSTLQANSIYSKSSRISAPNALKINSLFFGIAKSLGTIPGNPVDSNNYYKGAANDVFVNKIYKDIKLYVDNQPLLFLDNIDMFTYAQNQFKNNSLISYRDFCEIGCTGFNFDSEPLTIQTFQKQQLRGLDMKNGYRDIKLDVSIGPDAIANPQIFVISLLSSKIYSWRGKFSMQQFS